MAQKNVPRKTPSGLPLPTWWTTTEFNGFSLSFTAGPDTTRMQAKSFFVHMKIKGMMALAEEIIVTGHWQQDELCLTVQDKEGVILGEKHCHPIPGGLKETA